MWTSASPALGAAPDADETLTTRLWRKAWTEGRRVAGAKGRAGENWRDGRTKRFVTLTCCVTYVHAKQSDCSVISHIAGVKERTKITFEMRSE